LHAPKIQAARLSVRVPESTSSARLQDAFCTLSQSSSSTLKRASSREQTFCTLPERLSVGLSSAVDKAHVAAHQWPIEDILLARLSDHSTLKRAYTNSAHINSFLFSFQPFTCCFIDFSAYLERELGLF